MPPRQGSGHRAERETGGSFVITHSRDWLKRDRWRWVLRAANGETIATGEHHTRAADAVRAADRVRAIAAGAVIVVPDRTEPDGRD